MPWRVNRRTVASRIDGPTTGVTQPAISATRPRREPVAGNTCGASAAHRGGKGAGAKSSRAAIWGNRSASKRRADGVGEEGGGSAEGRRAGWGGEAGRRPARAAGTKDAR